MRVLVGSGRMMILPLLVLRGEGDLDETGSSLIPLGWRRRLGLLYRCLGRFWSRCVSHGMRGRSGPRVEVSCWYPSGNGHGGGLGLFCLDQKSSCKGWFFEKEVGKITVVVDGDESIVFDVC